MTLFHLLKRLESAPEGAAICTGNSAPVSRSGILSMVKEYGQILRDRGIRPGEVVVLSGDYSAPTTAALLALIANQNIVVPTTDTSTPGWKGVEDIICPQWIIDTQNKGLQVASTLRPLNNNDLYHELRRRQHSGLVLLSSGTAGRPKAVVHDFVTVLSRFDIPARPVRSLAFMRFDHIGGIYSLLACLYNLGTLFYSSDRHPDVVGRFIENHGVELLPTTASYLNLLLLTRPWRRNNFHSLKYILYGSERVRASTLAAIKAELPWVRFHQNYGLSEIGLLRSTAIDEASVWIRIDDDHARVRVRNGILEVKSELTMLGYLNAEHALTEDGWYITGDLAQEKDGQLHILGRQSDLIKVGGYSVFPSEIEDVLLQMPGVVDAMVGKEANSLMGEIAVATVHACIDEDEQTYRRKLREHCQKHLDRHKIPSKFVVSKRPLQGHRFKRGGT